jgi:uncharacterized protein with HEPN domain
MSTDDAWILQIVQASKKAIDYAHGIDQSAFESNAMLHDAVMLQLVVIGEAAGKLSETFRAVHPEIPWKKIRATRNVIAHSYAIVDLERVWIAVVSGLPEILESLTPLVSADFPPRNEAETQPDTG